MCGPIALAITGGVIMGVGRLAQGFAARQSYLANAQLLERQADQERLRGLYEIGQYSKSAAATLSTTRAAAAAGSVGLSGSVLEATSSIAAETEIDIAAIRYGAEVDAGNMEFQGSINRANARRAIVGAVLGAAGDVVGGFASAASRGPIFQNRSVLPAGGYTF